MESFTLTWEDSSAVAAEEVISCIEEEATITEVIEEEVVIQDDDMPHENGQEEIVQDEIVHDENMIYMQDNNVLVMQPGTDGTFMEELVVTEEWNDETCPEIVVGSEENIGEGEATNDDVIPLPTDQDEYTAARPYPCDFCSRRFRKKANLMNHMVAHQSDRPHSCNLCGVRYIRKCDLMNHLKIHAYVPETETFEEEQIGEDSDGEKIVRRRLKPVIRKKKTKLKIKEEYMDIFETADEKPIKYNYAEEDMRMMEEMENNVRTDFHEYLPSNSGMREQRYPVTDPKKPFVCQHCGVGFAREKALASHSRMHAGDSPFECNKCGEMFWDIDLMREHQRSKHAGGMAKGDEDMEDDEEDYSDDGKYGEFFCSTCGLSFHRQENLKRHQRIHIKEEYVEGSDFGHVCNVCGESFQEALDLLAHAEVHARGIDLRCMICGETCPTEELLAEHVQAKHGKNLPPNTCLMCGRTCRDKRTLLKHSFEHNKEKVFGCSKCPKTFHNKARLKRHMLSHR